MLTTCADHHPFDIALRLRNGFTFVFFHTNALLTVFANVLLFLGQLKYALFQLFEDYFL